MKENLAYTLHCIGTNGVPSSVMSFKSLVELDSADDSGDNEVEETNNFGSFS